MRTFLCLFLTLVLAQESFADEQKSSFFAPNTEANRPRSDVFMPLASFILPGLDQWIEGHYGSAAAYSGLAVGGMAYSSAIQKANDLEHAEELAKKKREESGEKEQPDVPYSLKDTASRKVQYGQQLYMFSGGLSAYHSFRTAAYSRKSQGQYDFLTEEETPLDLMKAPFRFDFLSRKTTWIPLTVAGALGALTASGKLSDTQHSKLTGADMFFASAASYNAGVWEEAAFRGWMMPALREYTDSDSWALVGSSGLFALAHLNYGLPLPQLVLGIHLGMVTQENNYTLSESIFIHAWWDVIVFMSSYTRKAKDPEPKTPAILWLPPLNYAF